MPSQPGTDGGASRVAPFASRRAAGRELAARLEPLRGERPLIVALDHGGLQVGAEVARELAAAWCTLFVARIGESGSRIGAVADDGPAIVDHDAARALGIGAEALARARERAEHAARLAAPLPDVTGRTVVLVSDALVTGLSAIAAGHAVRRRGAARIVAAAPLVSAEAVERLGGEVDEIVYVRREPRLGRVEDWYGADVFDVEAEPRAGGVNVLGEHGRLIVPEAARGAVLVAASLDGLFGRSFSGAGFATLRPSADAPTAARVTEAVRWLEARLETARLPLGLFGLGSGAAAVLRAGAEGGAAAIVAAGGRPGLAGDRLERVTAPTLLIAAGEEHGTLERARAARSRMRASDARIAVVAGATEGFPERGARGQVASLAVGWFGPRLRRAEPPPGAPAAGDG